MLIGGFDEDGPSLFFMDYLSSCVKLPFAIHGYGSYFGLSICDKYYKKDMNEAEALVLLNKIIAEVSELFLFFLNKKKWFIFFFFLNLDSKKIPC
jgi:20S proteasome subunit beta 4